MKKLVLVVAFCAIFASVGLFAESTGKYQVNLVSGKVQYEVAAGVWENVSEGMQIAADSKVSTGLNSMLVVTDGKSTYTLKPMQKGSIDSLCKALASKKAGIKMGSKVVASDIDASATKAKKAVSTASSRAASAEDSVDWAE